MDQVQSRKNLLGCDRSVGLVLQKLAMLDFDGAVICQARVIERDKCGAWLGVLAVDARVAF
jgi:hypothetical protein